MLPWTTCGLWLDCLNQTSNNNNTMSTAKATATANTTLLLSACEKKNESEKALGVVDVNNNNVTTIIERAAIDSLVGARLELHKAENDVRDNALAIAVAERALQQAKMRKGIVEYNASSKRKAVEEANVHVSRRARRTSRQLRARLGCTPPRWW
jgi:hypothetical protein